MNERCTRVKVVCQEKNRIGSLTLTGRSSGIRRRMAPTYKGGLGIKRTTRSRIKIQWLISGGRLGLMELLYNLESAQAQVRI